MEDNTPRGGGRAGGEPLVAGPDVPEDPARDEREGVTPEAVALGSIASDAQDAAVWFEP